MLRTVCTALVCLATVLGASNRAAADDTTRARELFRAGVEHLRADRFAEAVDALRASYERAPRAATICNLALAYDRWASHAAEAADAYDRCAAQEGSERFREHALDRARELRAALAAIAAPPSEPALSPSMPTPAPSPAPPTEPPAAAPARSTPSDSRSVSGWLVAGIATASVGAGVLAVAIGLDLQAGADQDYLDSRYPTGEIPATIGGAPNPDVERLSSARSADRWSTVLYASAGGLLALGAGAITWTFLQSDDHSPSSATLAIRPVSSGALLVLGVRAR